MGAHDAQGQNTGVPAQPLGDSFVFFVDRIAPTGTGEILLKVGDGNVGLPDSYEVVNDPEDADNRVLKLINHAEYAYPRFYFADHHDQGVPRNLTANRDAGNVLHFRIMVDENNPKDGGGNIVEQYRLAIQFEDYGPDEGGNDSEKPNRNYPFRLRWAIPDNMRDGEWHDVELTLPPSTWAMLEDARNANPSTLSDLEKGWKYTGSWAGFPIALDLLGPQSPTRFVDPNDDTTPDLWSEFEWHSVESFGIQWDWGGSNNPRAPIYLESIPLADPSILSTWTIILYDNGLLRTSVIFTDPSSSPTAYDESLNFTIVANNIQSELNLLNLAKLFLLVSSVIIPLAVAVSPEITWPCNDEGIVKLRLNLSCSSTISSIVTGTLTIALVVPAVKVALIGVES